MNVRRWRSIFFLSVVVVACSSLVSSAGVADAAATTHASVLARIAARMQVPIPASPRLRYAVVPYPGPRTAALATAQLPTWTHTVDSPAGNPFSYTMVGGDPFTAGTGTTTVSVPVIGVHLVFSSGGQTDASAIGSDCGMTDSPVQAVLGSPLFNASVNGTQYLDAFQRANFNDATGASATSPDYHLLLSGSQAPTLTLAVPATDGLSLPAGCGSNPNAVEAAVDIDWLQAQLTAAMSTLADVSPQNFPVFVLYDTLMTLPGGVVSLGFHSVVPSNIQTYAVADYQNINLGPGGPSDVTALAHETVEWADDPFGDNLVPTWGYVGQVTSGCQTSLEVADPLSNIAAQPVTVGTATYHLPDAAFTSWFFRESPSSAAGGAYSFFGTFSQPSDSKVCPAQPVGAKASPGNGQLTVSWNEPAGTAPIDSFVVLIFKHQDNVNLTTSLSVPTTSTLDTVTSATAAAGSTSAILSGLTNGTAYDAVVVARSVNQQATGSCVPLFVALSQQSTADDCSTPSFVATATPAASGTAAGPSGGSGQSTGASPNPSPNPNPNSQTLASTTAPPVTAAASSADAQLAVTGADHTPLVIALGSTFMVIGALGRRRLTKRKSHAAAARLLEHRDGR